jgi:hypothetical protein
VSFLTKKCAKCTKNATRTGNDSDIKIHKCVKIFEGSSKSMEAAGLVLMLNRMPMEKNVSVCTIISDDDSNARAKAQHVLLLEIFQIPYVNNFSDPRRPMF